MKKFKMNKMILCLSSLCLFAGLGTSCDSNNGKFKIGVLQYAVHGALDSAYEGFVKALDDEIGHDNYTISLSNASGDSTTNATMASQLAEKNFDLLLGIATPSAQALQAAVFSAGKTTPILFTAVTDPVSSNLITSNENPGANITGTNDMNPVADQIDLFKQIDSSISKIGFLYCSSEANSVVQKGLAETEATAQGLTLDARGVASSADISTTIDAMITGGIKGLYIPTDNTIAAAMGTVFNACKTKSIPVVCGESNMLTKGGMFSLGVNYKNLGVTTGMMAKKILVDGKKPSEIPSTGADEAELFINKDLCDEASVSVPQALLNQATLVTSEE